MRGGAAPVPYSRLNVGHVFPMCGEQLVSSKAWLMAFLDRARPLLGIPEQETTRSSNAQATLQEPPPVAFGTESSRKSMHSTILWEVSA